ncbi:unnamed protein product [Caretta caretta]
MNTESGVGIRKCRAFLCGCGLNKGDLCFRGRNVTRRAGLNGLQQSVTLSCLVRWRRDLCCMCFKDHRIFSFPEASKD